MTNSIYYFLIIPTSCKSTQSVIYFIVFVRNKYNYLFSVIKYLTTLLFSPYSESQLGNTNFYFPFSFSFITRNFFLGGGGVVGNNTLFLFLSYSWIGVRRKNNKGPVLCFFRGVILRTVFLQAVRRGWVTAWSAMQWVVSGRSITMTDASRNNATWTKPPTSIPLPQWEQVSYCHYNPDPHQ